MPRIILVVLMVGIAVHGLIHLMGFVAYWPLGQIKDLPYKTSVLNGRWELGSTGMRVYSVLWLLAALGFVAAATGFLLGRQWWLPLMTGTTVLSILITVLDWKNAFRGTVIDVVILTVLLLKSIFVLD